VKSEAAVQELIPQYDLLFNHTDQFTDENPGMDVEAILDIMDSFVRYNQNMVWLGCS
jgi:hypothetical protein